MCVSSDYATIAELNAAVASVGQQLAASQSTFAALQSSIEAERAQWKADTARMHELYDAKGRALADNAADMKARFKREMVSQAETAKAALAKLEKEVCVCVMVIVRVRVRECVRVCVMGVLWFRCVFVFVSCEVVCGDCVMLAFPPMFNVPFPLPTLYTETCPGGDSACQCRSDGGPVCC